MCPIGPKPNFMQKRRVFMDNYKFSMTTSELIKMVRDFRVFDCDRYKTRAYTF